jgi:hypothetical protein
LPLETLFWMIGKMLRAVAGVPARSWRSTHERTDWSALLMWNFRLESSDVEKISWLYQRLTPLIKRGMRQNPARGRMEPQFNFIHFCLINRWRYVDPLIV